MGVYADTGVLLPGDASAEEAILERKGTRCVKKLCRSYVKAEAIDDLRTRRGAHCASICRIGVTRRCEK